MTEQTTNPIAKRFALFVFEHYYPRGGWSDFVATFDTVDDAKHSVVGDISDCFQIVDLTTAEVVVTGANVYDPQKSREVAPVWKDAK